MKKTLIVSFAIILSQQVIASDVTKVNGGSVKTDLGYNIVLNKDSSLQREWIAVHDSNVPASFSGTYGVKTVYRAGKGSYSRGDYLYKANYEVVAEEPLSAIEVRFLTFDIWGNHVRNLTATDVSDLAAGSEKSYDSKWKVYSENEVSDYYASIAYVAQVRTKSGKVIKADIQAVLTEARKFSKKFSESDLEPESTKK